MKLLSIVMGLMLCTFATLQAQVTLTGTSYTENFDGISTALPTGWSVYKLATSSTVGTAVTLATTATAWKSTSGGAFNYASADGFTIADTTNTTGQAASTDRALGYRQTGSNGDPGASFMLQIANTTGMHSFHLSFKFQSLDNAVNRVTKWKVQYAIGATPTTFTDLTTNFDSLYTGGNNWKNTDVEITSTNFGTAIDNQAGPIWIRIVALTASVGSGSRPVTAIDDVNLTWSTGAASTATDIVSFNFNGLTPSVTGTVDATAHTVALTVPFGTPVTALVPTITVSAGAIVSPATAVAQNFTAPVTYTVTAEDGTTTQNWTVTVTVAPASSAKDITLFNFNGLTPTVVGTLDATAHTVALTVPFGTAVTALVPTITVSDFAVVSPATAVATDFTAPVIYTVTAQDGTTQVWTVTVTVAPASSAKDILTFNFNGLTPAVVGTVNATAHTVALTVPFGTAVTALVPTITVSDFATVSPATAVAADFTAPVVYTVTAQDGTTQTWTVTVSVTAGSSAKDILAFNFNGLTPAVVGTVNATAHTVALTVPFGTNVTALVPTITVSALATVSPATAVAQNFTAPVVYTVTAQDGTTQAWTVTVTISVGINEVTENVASIYPNPAIDVVNVKMNSTINKIAVVNMNGQVVMESLINNNEGSINTSTIANGMYFLRIETANGITMNKIQIVK